MVDLLAHVYLSDLGLTQVYNGHSSIVRSVSFEPSGQWFASGSFTMLVLCCALLLQNTVISQLFGVLLFSVLLVHLFHT